MEKYYEISISNWRMKLLIVAATRPEIEETIMWIKKYSSSTNKNIKIKTLVTGIGMVATAYFLGKELSKQKYNLVINAGIAGAFSSNIGIGDTVIVSQDRFSELGAEDGNEFLSLNEINLQNESEFPFQNGVIYNHYSLNLPSLNKLKQVKGITVNTIHGNQESIGHCINMFNPDIETMEGASVFYVCKHEDTPCIQIRTISNFIEKRNRNNWNIPLAVNNLNILITKLLQELNLQYAN